MSNTQIATKPKFTAWMANIGNTAIANVINNEKARNQFATSLCTAVANNPKLAECTPNTILSAGLQSEALKLPINNLGYSYIIPYNNRKQNTVEAQFQIGYKGYIQLAIRSGLYEKINVIEVKEGELGAYNPLVGEIDFNWEMDFEKRESLKTIGYAGFIKLKTGFEKIVYKSREEILNHADTYSPAFSKEKYKELLEGKIPQKELWKYSSFWYKNFDEMAKKTVIKNIISKWGIMSIEIQDALVSDYTIQNDNEKYYPEKEISFEQEINENANKNIVDLSEETKEPVVDMETGEILDDQQVLFEEEPPFAMG